jgi:hypothetical protein
MKRIRVTKDRLYSKHRRGRALGIMEEVMGHLRNMEK